MIVDPLIFDPRLFEVSGTETADTYVFELSVRERVAVILSLSRTRVDVILPIRDKVNLPPLPLITG
jgi:hypothetical protein